MPDSVPLRSPADEVVRRAIFLSRVEREDLISVAGPSGLAAMISLCRDGFERVECARQSTCAGADEACDLLVIVGRMDASTLQETVRRTARLVRDGGELACELAGAADELVVRRALARAGFEARLPLVDATGRLALFTVFRSANRARLAG
jgi:hypothetical protein